MSIQYNLTANTGQFTEPVAIMSNTKVTTTNGYIQWAPNTLADYKNNNVVWQNWPIGTIAGNAISLNQMIIRLVAIADGATAVVDQGNKGAANFGSVPSNAYWLAGNIVYTQSSTTNSIQQSLSSLQSITTPYSSLRGVAHRGGWPSSSQGNQLAGPSLWPVEAGSNYRLKFVGANTYFETSNRNGSCQAYVEAPYGSGNWIQVLFNASPTGTFITTGSTPDESNNYFTLLSDPIPVTFTTPQILRVFMSAKGGFPCMTNYDGYLEGKGFVEFTMSSASANDNALQCANIGVEQIKNIVNNAGDLMTRRVCSSASWVPNTLTLQVLSHGTSGTNNKIILQGFVSTGADINSVFSFGTSGGDTLTVSTSNDPGTITQLGLVRIAQAITTATWLAGVVTIVRAAHGFIEGQVISIRGLTATGAAPNGDFPIASIVDANTFTVNFAANAGTITTTNAYMFAKYSASSTDFHLRPYSIVAESNVACLFLDGDSTTQTVDRIQDETRLCGVTQRCVGEVFPFMDGSANNEGLSHALASPNQVIIRDWLRRTYCQGTVFGWSKNDEDFYSTAAAWQAAHDQWWNRPVMDALRSSQFNFAVKAPPRTVITRDNWTTVEGQVKPANTRLVQFHQFLNGKVGTLYRSLFDYISLLTVRNQPYAYDVYDDWTTITVTTTAGSAAVSVDAGTPLTPYYNNRVILIPGAGDGGEGGTDAYVRINRISNTKFIAMNISTGNNIPLPAVSSVAAVTATIGVSRFIGYGRTTNTLHENFDAEGEITKKIALKRMF